MQRARLLDADDLHRAPIRAYVHMLAREAADDELLDLRFRLPHGGMAQRFFPAQRPAGLVEATMRLSRRADVYVGCALRSRPHDGRDPHGGRDAVSRSWVLWADCDTPESIAAVQRFTPPPSMVIASGGGWHAYWALDAPIACDALEDANRRIAQAVGADAACWDATRILRPPGTHNFRYEPPAAVTLETFAENRRYPLAEVLELVPPCTPTAQPRTQPTTHARRDDPLLEVEPARYVTALLGTGAPRHGKVSCPFHEDKDPSLHVYREASRGWFCFSCRRGGSIYDLAAELWDHQTRGPAFRVLRRRLAAVLDIDLDRGLPER